MNDEKGTDLLDILSEAEIDLINYLRGYTEEGEDTPNGWRLTV